MFPEVQEVHLLSGEWDLLIKVKEVNVEGKRYIVCLNPRQARKDALDRGSIVKSLKEKLHGLIINL